MFRLVLYGAPATVYCDRVTLIFAFIIIIIIVTRYGSLRCITLNIKIGGAGSSDGAAAATTVTFKCAA